jgi:hypothetical protein
MFRLEKHADVAVGTMGVEHKKRLTIASPSSWLKYRSLNVTQKRREWLSDEKMALRWRRKRIST